MKNKGEKKMEMEVKKEHSTERNQVPLWFLVAILLIAVLVALLLLGPRWFSAPSGLGNLPTLWTEVQKGNLEFHRAASEALKAKRPRAEKLSALKTEAVRAAARLDALRVQVAAVKSEVGTLLMAALDDTVGYYKTVATTCGDPKGASFGTLMALGQSAREKYRDCANRAKLEPRLPADAFIGIADKLSAVLKEPATLVYLPNTSRGMQVAVLADSVYTMKMRDILRRYLVSRKALQRFTDWLRGGRRSVFAYSSDLEQALAERQMLLSQVELIEPDSGFERVHAAFKDVLQDAVMATSWADSFVKSSGEGSWRWDEFKRVSDTISQRLPAIQRAYGVRE